MSVDSQPRSTSFLQQVVDDAAILNLYSAPKQGRAVSGTSIHSMEIKMPWPTQSGGARAQNLLGEKVGNFQHQIVAIPYGHKMLPGRGGPSVPFDSEVSQRIAFQPAILSFGSLGTVECFGTGRTYPMMLGGRPQLAAAAITDIRKGTGVFRGLPGNLTFCGVLTENYLFRGHIIVRIVDERRVLCLADLIRNDYMKSTLGPEVTYLNFVGQKGSSTDQENCFSKRADGQPRGLNISTELKQSRVGLQVKNTRKRVSTLQTGDAIGREIGFGPLPSLRIPSDGLPLRPFPFEGVARYSFHDQQHHSVGSLTTNVTEGRRFDIKFAKVPDQVGFRFGFFGPITYGVGCFRNVRGLFYGASASFLSPPPGDHVVTHFYAAMLDDPDGKYRA